MTVSPRGLSDSGRRTCVCVMKEMEEVRTTLFSMALSGAIVARAADTALRQPLPGAPPRLAGNSLECA